MTVAHRPAVLLAAIALTACAPKAPDGSMATAGLPTTAPASAGTDPAPAAEPFDVTTVPLAPAPLPSFPYIDWPESVPAADREVVKQAASDNLTVIAGEQLLALEGQIEQRRFSVPQGSSPLAIRRYYRERITALGGVAANRLQPVGDAAVVVEAVRTLFPADADPARRLDLQRYDEGDYQYEVYVARTEPAQAWFVVQTSAYSAVVTTLAVATP